MKFWENIKVFIKALLENMPEDELTVDELREVNNLEKVAKDAKKTEITSSIEIGSNGVQKVSTTVPTASIMKKRKDIERGEN